MAPKYRRPSPRDDHLSPVELPDAEDMETFNRSDADEYEQVGGGQEPGGRHWGWRLVALVVVGIFLGYLLNHWMSFWTWPSLEFVYESPRVKEERMLQEVDEAIVEIQAYSRSHATGTRRGTGFNVMSEGLIVTNRHVVDGAWRSDVSFDDGTRYVVEEWTLHPTADLAVAQLDAADLPILPVQLADVPRPGDALTVVGNPLGFPRVAVEAKMLRTAVLDQGNEPVMVIEGHIHPGSSGSPVLNKDGQVVAVVFATLGSSGSGRIRGVAVPIEQVTDIW